MTSENATDTALIWESFDAAVVIGNSARKVAIIGTGTATITIIAEEIENYKGARLSIMVKVEVTFYDVYKITFLVF